MAIPLIKNVIKSQFSYTLTAIQQEFENYFSLLSQ